MIDTQNQINQVKQKLVEALGLMKEAVVLTIPLLNTERRETIVSLWEAFLKEFLGFIKQKSKETGVNLLKYVSFHRIWLGRG